MSLVETRTLERGPSGDATLQPTRHLFLLLQAARPLAASSRHALVDVDEVEIGRGDALGFQRRVDGGVRRLRIDVPDAWMSTVHLRLRVRVASVLAADAGSKNGTRIDGVATPGAELDDGAVIEAGRTLFLYAAQLPAPANAPLDTSAADLRAPPGLRTFVPDLALRFDELTRVAPSPAPVLVLGPTGTGKELVARAVHALSSRTGPFVAVNCGAVAPALLESELFGHVKGAFSGATADRVGLVEMASGGTLFLDELGEIPERVQVALLRVLQEREVIRVGASTPVPVDLRVVAATHRDPAAAVRAGTLREDFVARVRGFVLELPPLAARVPDVGLLVAALLERLAGARAAAVELDVEAARALVAHAWPQNIRELERALETALALAGAGPILPRHLKLEAPAPAAAVADDPLRSELLALLAQHQGNVSAVATAIGKKRQQIQKWLKKYGIDPDRYR